MREKQEMEAERAARQKAHDEAKQKLNEELEAKLAMADGGGREQLLRGIRKPQVAVLEDSMECFSMRISLTDPVTLHLAYACTTESVKPRVGFAAFYQNTNRRLVSWSQLWKPNNNSKKRELGER